MWPACRAPAAALALLAGSLLAVVMSDAEADKLNACRDLGCVLHSSDQVCWRSVINCRYQAQSHRWC